MFVKENLNFLKNLGDIKEEEDGCEEEEFSNRMKEIQDLKILQEELKKIEKKASQFKERKNQSKAEIFQKENSHEDFKRSSNEKTKKIYNNLRYFDANETQFTNKSPIPDKKENVKPLLSSLTTIISKPNITSTNSINLECFMNENFKKDSQLNENDSFEEREKYAKIFSEEDYSDK